jgi:tetratricopeptide (TPR) repeat protein
MARHYSRSEKLEKALQYLKLSGDKTSQHYSNWESLYFYKEAIGVLNKLPDTEENKRRMIEVILLMEGPMRLLGYPEDSLQILQEGEKLRGIEYSEKAFRKATIIEDIELMAPIAFDLCSSYTMLSNHQLVPEVAIKVLSLLEQQGRESDFFSGPYNFNLYSSLSAYCGNSMGVMGNLDEGRALCEKALRFALQTDNPYSIAFAELMCCQNFVLRGDGKNAIPHAHNAIRYGEEGQVLPLVAIAWVRLGEAHYFLGDLEESKKHIEKGLNMLGDAGLHINRNANNVAMAMTYIELGDLNSARRYAETAMRLPKKSHVQKARGEIMLATITAKQDKSQSSKMEGHILQGIKTLDSHHVKLYSSIGELYTEAGQTEKARQILTLAEGMFQEMGMDYWQRRTQEVLEKL